MTACQRVIVMTIAIRLCRFQLTLLLSIKKERRGLRSHSLTRQAIICTNCTKKKGGGEKC